MSPRFPTLLLHHMFFFRSNTDLPLLTLIPHSTTIPHSINLIAYCAESNFGRTLTRSLCGSRSSHALFQHVGRGLLPLSLERRESSESGRPPRSDRFLPGVFFWCPLVSCCWGTFLTQARPPRSQSRGPCFLVPLLSDFPVAPVTQFALFSFSLCLVVHSSDVFPRNVRPDFAGFYFIP